MDSARHPLRLPALLCILAAAGLAAGCATGGVARPAAPDPGVALPERWTADPAVAATEPGAWVADFDSPRLEGLVDRALARNPDIAAAAARVSAARARAAIAGAALWPQLEAGASAARSRTVADAGGDPVARTADRFELEGRVSWEVDLWDRLGDAARAAALEAEAAGADYRAARLALAAEVARGWFAAIESRQQLELARRVAGIFRESEGIIAERYRRGIGTALDLRLARENTASAEATLAQRRREHDAAIRALEALLGRYPDAATDIPAELPALAREVPAGLPATLLERRPDLVAARERLAAASARLREAGKNRLPTVRLTGAAGTASPELADLLDLDYLVWSLFADLVQPVFEGGRLEAERVLAAADDREAWARYAAAVLTALREVETALAAEAHLADREAALERAAEEALEAAQLALERYRQGLTDIVTLLESQRRAVNAESTRLLVSRLRLENRVNLYLALGGPFAAPPAATARADAAGPDAP